MARLRLPSLRSPELGNSEIHGQKNWAARMPCGFDSALAVAAADVGFGGILCSLGD